MPKTHSIKITFLQAKTLFLLSYCIPMKTVEFREALREAMSEEMRRDEKIFFMGWKVSELNGN